MKPIKLFEYKILINFFLVKKAVVGFEMQESGYLAKRLYPDGAKNIPLGKVI